MKATRDEKKLKLWWKVSNWHLWREKQCSWRCRQSLEPSISVAPLCSPYCHAAVQIQERVKIRNMFFAVKCQGLSPLRPLIRVMRRPDLTNQKTITNHSNQKDLPLVKPGQNWVGGGLSRAQRLGGPEDPHRAQAIEKGLSARCSKTREIFLLGCFTVFSLNESEA